MNEKKIMLVYTGKRAEIANQFQKWCQEYGVSMNAKIYDLIQALMKRENRK